jgi:beta-phosphoglucomutase-like phosphatase (HAD superfamily)
VTEQSFPIQAFVFDMDGTILDNMGFHTEAWMQTIEELGQAPRDPQEWERVTSGTPNHEIFRNLLGLEDFDDAGVARWVERKESLYRERSIGRLVELAGFSLFVERARELDVRVGLATGAGPENIAFNLEALGLADAFDVIVGAADVTKGKPNPEVFLTSAARLEVPPSSVLVFEDAPLGIDAARAAGMGVVGVTTMLSADALLEMSNVLHAIENFADLHPSTLVGSRS